MLTNEPNGSYCNFHQFKTELNSANKSLVIALIEDWVSRTNFQNNPKSFKFVLVVAVPIQ